MPRIPMAGRDDLQPINQLPERSHSGSGEGDSDDDDDSGPRLAIVSHEFSRAQKLYVAARHRDNPDAPIFYKDATPRAEHYVRCGVEVYGVNHGIDVPAKLEVCFCDGISVNSKFVTRPGKPETEALKVLGEGSKSLTITPGSTTYFDYRIEVGSLRADDRKFCVKVVPNAPHVAGVLPAVTPGLLVLSKKRLTGPDGQPESGDPLRKRRKAQPAPPAQVAAIAYDPLPSAAPPPPSRAPPMAPAMPPPATLPPVPQASVPVHLDGNVLSQTREILHRVAALEGQIKHLVGHVEALVAAGWAPPGGSGSASPHLLAAPAPGFYSGSGTPHLTAPPGFGLLPPTPGFGSVTPVEALAPGPAQERPDPSLQHLAGSAALAELAAQSQGP